MFNNPQKYPLNLIFLIGQLVMRFPHFYLHFPLVILHIIQERTLFLVMTSINPKPDLGKFPLVN